MSFMEWYMVIACFGVALLCLYWHCRAIWLWISIPNWPRVEAVVRKSIIRQKSSRHRHYALDIDFGYRFRGQDYTGRQPVPGGLVTQSKQGVEAVAATMVEGTIIKVHVNPRRPREAYAAPVASWRIVALLICALVFGGAGTLILYKLNPDARTVIDGILKPEPE
tara:strand:- start:228 stop:722 length:495 start_codon:yes stop_codon:yes gene_type:complete